MEVDEVELTEQTDEIEVLQPRKRGRPSGSKTTKVPRDTSTVGSTRYKNYYTGHHNKAQDTQAAWAWIDGLHDDQKEILDLTVYRDWPLLKMPLTPPDGAKRKNPKSIAEQIPGTAAFKTDQDLVHMFGAGNYRVYVNVNPPGGARRELFCAVVKATHDFRAFPPTDWRIDNIEEVDIADPSNGSYVAWLRSQGKVPDEGKESREKEDMAAGSALMVEFVKDMAQDRRELTQKLLEKTEQDKEILQDPPPSAEEKLNESLTLLEKLQNFTKGSPTADPMAMMTAVIEAAKVMSQSNSPQALTPLMDRIAVLEGQLRTQESEMLRGQLTEIRGELRAMKEAPQSNITLADGTSVEGIISKVLDRLADKPEVNPWLDIVKGAMPALLPLFGGIAQRLMMPSPAAPAFPMPPPTYTAGVPPQQAQIPAPAQPQRQPAAQQQAAPQQAGGAYTTGNGPLDHLLMMIQVPLADHLRDGDSGEQFAEFFIQDFGIDTHTQLATFGADAITNILYSYPPLGPILKPLKRESVVKFVGEFVSYKPAPEPPPA